MLERLQDLRARYFQDLDTLVDLGAVDDLGQLTDTNAVETEAEVAAASENVMPEVREVVVDLYRRCLARYEYVKEANDKFLAMLDEELAVEPSSDKAIAAIRRFAESILLDPIDQPMAFTHYDEDDVVDGAQVTTQAEAVLYGDGSNIDVGYDV